MEPDRKFYVFLCLAIFETFALFWFSLVPSVGFVNIGFMRLGDPEHLTAYILYGFLVYNVLKYFLGEKTGVLVSIVIGSFVGGLCETIQLFLPYRAGDIIDFGIDVLGSFTGGFAGSKFKTLFQNIFK